MPSPTPTLDFFLAEQTATLAPDGTQYGLPSPGPLADIDLAEDISWGHYYGERPPAAK